MDFGIGIATSSDSWKLAQRAEELGFTHAWFFDTQMITGDCFVAMAAAALKTTRIHLGTGVLVPSNRIAAVTANAFATLNGMAPGRIDFGIGTGFSARRAMGLGAVKLAEMEEYIRVVYGLLKNETVETSIEGKRRKIRFLNPEIGLINTKEPIPLHISAYGPRSQALTAKLGAGWKSFVSDVPGAMAAIESMQQSWQKAGRTPNDLYATAWTCGCVLAEGEPADSPRAMAQAGPRAAVLLHRAADFDMEGWQNTSPVPQDVATEIAGYVEMARHYEPPDALPDQPPRPFCVRQTRGAQIRHRRADPAHHLHSDRAGDQTARRGPARGRLEPARDRDYTRRGTSARRLGAHQARL
jgi:5,10-methylenetetrahydromethanopterin reductase